MKKILLATVALGALTFGAQAAGPAPYNMLTGDFAIAGGFAGLSFEGSDSKTGVLFAGLARAQYFFMPNWSVQFDINGESFYSGEDNKAAVFNIAAHIGYHTPAWMIGAMLSKGFNANSYDNFVTLAVEGAYRMGPMLLYGQAGYTSMFGYDVSGWYLHKELAYFLNPNLMVSGDLGLVWMNGYSDYALRALRWGVTVERKFTSSPFGVFARAEGSFRDYENYGNVTEAAIKIGFRGYFYGGPLQGGLFRRDFNPCTGVNFLRGGCYNDYNN